MSDPALAVQTAIYAALDAALSVPVYDSAPQDAAFPYVTFDFQDVANRDMLNQRMDNRTFYFAVWSDYRGQKEVLEVMAAIDAALHEKRLTLSTGRLVQMRVLSKRTNREPDGLTYMGQLRLQVLTEH